MNIRKNSELRTNPLNNPVKIHLTIEKDSLAALKKKALELGTTYSEIIRALIEEYLENKTQGEGRQ